MGGKSSKIKKPHTSIPLIETPPAQDSTTEPPTLPRQPSPLPVSQTLFALPVPQTLFLERPYMGVKSLIHYFNIASTSPVTQIPAVPREPVYCLNGKVKHLVREFSKSSQSLPSSNLGRPFERVKNPIRTTYSEPEQPDNGGATTRSGVFQGPARDRQVSEEASGAGYVASIQPTNAPQQQKPKKQPKQQYKKAAQASVELVPNVTRIASRGNGIRHSEQGSARRRGVSPRNVAFILPVSGGEQGPGRRRGRNVAFTQSVSGGEQAPVRRRGVSPRNVAFTQSVSGGEQAPVRRRGVSPRNVASTQSVSGGEQAPVRRRGVSPRNVASTQSVSGGEQAPVRRWGVSPRNVAFTQPVSGGETSISPARNLHRSTIPIQEDGRSSKIDTLAAVFEEQNRLDPIDSVVMSARHSEARKSRSVSFTSSGRGRHNGTLPSVRFATGEEHIVLREPNKSTEPPPLTIIKVRKPEPQDGPGPRPDAIHYEQPRVPALRVPSLAPPAQRYLEPHEFIQSSQPPSISNSISISPVRSTTHTQHSTITSKQEWEQTGSKQEWEQTGMQQAGETLSRTTGNMHLAPPSIVLALPVEQANSGDRGSTSRILHDAHTTIGTSSDRLSGRRAYQTLPHQRAPRMRLYDDTEWMNQGRQPSHKSMGQADGGSQSPFDTTDSFSISWGSWDAPTSLEDSPSIAETGSLIHSPLSPPSAQFRNYILNPGNTAGKYSSLPGRKIVLIKPLLHPYLEEQIGSQQYNPRFSTFTRQESLSNSSLLTLDQDQPSLESLMDAKEARRLKSAYKSPVQRFIAREDAASRAAGIMSPSYVGIGELSSVLRRANSVDAENRRYTSRRKQ